MTSPDTSPEYEDDRTADSDLQPNDLADADAAAASSAPETAEAPHETDRDHHLDSERYSGGVRQSGEADAEAHDDEVAEVEDISRRREPDVGRIDLGRFALDGDEPSEPLPKSESFDNTSEKAFIPASAEVTAAYRDILDHNVQHTGYAPAIRSTLDVLFETDEVDVNEDVVSASEPQANMASRVSEEQEKAVAEGDMDAELQGMFHDETFTRIGIKVEPYGQKVTSGGERAASTELVPVVESADLFTEYLSSLDPETVQEDDQNFRLMTDVIGTLDKTVTQSFAESAETETEGRQQELVHYGEDALRTFLEIDDEYRRLGIDRPATYQRIIDEAAQSKTMTRKSLAAKEHMAAYDRLEHYVEYWGRNVLPEYIAVGSMDKLENETKHYFDGGHEQLNAKVSQIVGLVGPERTTQYGVEAAQAMLTGVERTLQQMDEDPQVWFASASNRELLEQHADRLRSCIPS